MKQFRKSVGSHKNGV